MITLFARGVTVEVIDKDPPPPPPPPPPPTLPSWVPLPGNVAVLNNANGHLTNHFKDVCAPYYEEFYFQYVRNGDSGVALNPYWGAFGGIMCHGDGHACGNDNSVVVLEMGASALTFKRLTNPTPLFGLGTDTTTKSNNVLGDATSLREQHHGEYTLDGQPCASHTYAALDVVGPENGGAANGTLYKIIASSQCKIGLLDSIAAHKVDMPNSSGAAGAYSWRRASNNYIDVAVTYAPCYTHFVPAQNRIYWEARNNAAPPKWYDLINGTYNQGTGTPLNQSGINAQYSGVMCHVPERDLLLFAAYESGNLVIRWMLVRATDTNPSWSTPITLSQAISVGPGFSCLTWCPDNSRLIVGSVVGESAAVFEIAIPATLSNQWTVTRAPFGSGSITWPTQQGQYGAPTYKSWAYNAKTKSIVYFPFAANGGDDTVYVYRPRGT